MAIDPSTGLPANYTLPQQTTPSNYMLPQAEEARRKMAMELMYGKGQTQQPEMKHWTQLLGNLGNSALGNQMFNKTNDLGRKSDVHDSSTVEGGLWGQQRPPTLGVGGPTPFQASGPMPGQIGPQSVGGAPPNMPPQQMGGMPPLGAPPPGMTPGDIPGMPPGGQNLPNEGGMFGGLGWGPGAKLYGY